MTQLVLITEKQYREGVNEIGDIIGEFSDDQKFTSTELADFEIIKVEDTKDAIDLVKPQNKTIYRGKSLDWTDEEPERKNVWQDKDESWKEIVKDPKYKTRYEDKTIKENYSRYAENLTTIIGSK